MCHHSLHAPNPHTHLHPSRYITVVTYYNRGVWNKHVHSTGQVHMHPIIYALQIRHLIHLASAHEAPPLGLFFSTSKTAAGRLFTKYNCTTF